MAQVRWEEITLLYAEDDAASRRRIVAQMSRRYPGLRVVEAANGAEGVALYKEHRPDIVLTDLTLPVMDGIMMSETIKELDEEAIIVALSASSDTQNLLKAIDVGINGYLLKPVVYHKLFSLLDRKFRYLSLKRELQRQNEYVRKLSWAVERSPVSVVISDREGNIEYVNHQFEELTGYALDEVIGKNVSIQSSGETPPETYRELWRTLREGGVWQGEFLNKKKSGALYWEHASISPIYDGSGTITNYIAVKEDITQYKDMMRALQRSQSKFATLFHAVPALIMISTIDECTIVEVNRTLTQTMGYQRDEIVGEKVCDLAIWESPEERERVVRVMRGPLEGREVHNLEIRLRGRGGNSLVGLLSIVTLEVEEQSVLMSVIRDITERKEREAEIELLNERLAGRAAELEFANSELEAFNSMIAHDLRSPLNAINSYSQVIAEMCGEQLDPVCREYLRETYRGTLRMNQLIEALLNFSRLAHTVPFREPVDLSALAVEVAAELRHLAPRCTVSFEIPAGIEARCDPALVRVVLHNLLGNALKYNCSKGDLVVSFGMTREEGKAVYCVRDNGIGFDPADAEKIFRPFQRLAGPEEVPGHGIGLATVERIVKRHGGTVWAEGEAGKGAAFFFTLERE